MTTKQPTQALLDIIQSVGAPAGLVKAYAIAVFHQGTGNSSILLKVMSSLVGSEAAQACADQIAQMAEADLFANSD